jgi:aminocarboxymuconate-semialdehyde decarboxylase
MAASSIDSVDDQHDRAVGGPIIDIHAHHVPPTLIAEARRNGDSYRVRIENDDAGNERLAFTDGPTLRPFFEALCDLEGRLPRMDDNGIDVQVVSTWTDIAGYHLPKREGARWARLQNDTMADAARHLPDRFQAMGTLPMQDVPQALQEMRYAVFQLGFRSFEVCTNVNGRDLDDDEYRPFWALAAEMDVLVFLHPPVQQVGVERLGQYFLNNLLGNPMETTIAATRLIFSGLLQEFPRLKCLLAHGGGFLPFQIGRLDHGYTAVPANRVHLRQPPSRFLPSFFYDTILFNDQALAYLLNVVPVERVVLGSDYPFEMCDDDLPARLKRINLDRDGLAAVLGRTAEQLLGSAPGRDENVATAEPCVS